jgi:hypothetical protein
MLIRQVNRGAIDKTFFCARAPVVENLSTPAAAAGASSPKNDHDRTLREARDQLP